MRFSISTEHVYPDSLKASVDDQVADQPFGSSSECVRDLVRHD